MEAQFCFCAKDCLNCVFCVLRFFFYFVKKINWRLNIFCIRLTVTQKIDSFIFLLCQTMFSVSMVLWNTRKNCGGTLFFCCEKYIHLPFGFSASFETRMKSMGRAGEQFVLFWEIIFLHLIFQRFWKHDYENKQEKNSKNQEITKNKKAWVLVKKP